MKLNNDDLRLVYNIDQTLRFRDDEFLNDLSKINGIHFSINFNTTGNKFGFVEKVIDIINEERYKCSWNEIKKWIIYKIV